MSERERLLELCLEYELGTLEGDELREVEALLRRDDPAAMEVLAEARATVAALGLTAPDAAPAATVKTRLMAALAEEESRRTAPPTPPTAMPSTRLRALRSSVIPDGRSPPAC